MGDRYTVGEMNRGMLYEIRLVVDAEQDCSKSICETLEGIADIDVRAVAAKPLGAVDKGLNWEAEPQILENPMDPLAIDGWARAVDTAAIRAGLEKIPMISGPDLEDRLLENSGLLEAARSFLSLLIRIVEPALPCYALMVTDREGCCLDVRGDAKTMAQDYPYFSKGMPYGEAVIGNNGLGTALTLRRAIMFRGGEHFNTALRGWTTVGAPVMVGDELAGGLGLFFPGAVAGNDFTAILGAAAASVGGELARKSCQSLLLEKHRALFNAESQLHQVLDFLNIGVLILDPDLKVTFWNKAAEEMSGIRAEEVVGKDVYEGFPGVRQGNALLQTVLETSRSIKNQETMVVFGDRELNVLFSAFELHDARGQRAGVIDFFENLTRQKWLELNMLRTTKEIQMIRTAIDGLPWGVVILNRMGRLLYLNRMAAEVIGVSQEDCVGLRLSEIVEQYLGLAGDEAREFVQTRLQVMSSGEAVSGRVEWFKRATGDPFATICDIYPVTNDNGKVLGATAIYEECTPNARLKIKYVPITEGEVAPIAEAKKENLKVSVHWHTVRRAYGLRMNDFAERILEINANQYGKYERGLKLPSLPNVLLMAARVGLPVEAVYSLCK